MSIKAALSKAQDDIDPRTPEGFERAVQARMHFEQKSREEAEAEVRALIAHRNAATNSEEQLVKAS
jgi:hypothetical protein